MTHKQLVEQIAEQLNMPKTQVNSVLSEAGKVIKNGLEAKDKVTFSTLGSFVYSLSSERACINPRTKEKMMVPAKGKCSFKMSSELKESLAKIK